MSDIALVHATFADAAEAERIGRAMVERRLAACVNLLGPCRSIYRWQGRVEAADEHRALFKTTPALARELADGIAALHSYDLPAIEIWPAAGGDALAAWVAEATR
ncbi:divalent-cation tolerance protein CutA [Sphingomonas turrisvirgatae]|uniref:Divalent ion tolerance protein n=1 Tax=Sphingomonas turrisvirgatae TaxID=1888892 RepID=A0A1E3LWR6_9SPHN|nr:divalent-cation tolerance protein CutA [Sphingomonas turrisvirgatae]ODP37240.1 divalent ion tolerance protein [Sphingomonas turrisvirgatae]